jgi:hypothetical protein
MLSTFLAGASTTPLEFVGGYQLGFVGTTSDVTITFGGNLTGGSDASAQPNDLVIVYFGTGANGNENLIVAGYTEVVELFADDTYSTNLAVAYKFMGSTPDTTLVLTGGTRGVLDAGAVALQVWRNVDQVTPLDVVSTTATGINSVLCNPPQITPTSMGAYVVAGGAGAHAAGVRTFASSDLDGFTSVGSQDTYDVTIGLGYKPWVSGAVDPATFSFSGTNSTAYSWAAVTLAIRPK